MTTPHTSPYPPLGTVSEATHRPEHIVPAFLAVIRRYAPERVAILAPEEPALNEAGDYIDPEAAGLYLDDLFAEMEALAPPYAYFAGHPGDGSDFGFWPDLDHLDEDAADHGDVVKLPAGIRWEYDSRTGEVIAWPDEGLPPAKYLAGYVAEVTDHGNVTLYRAHDMRELWSVV